MYIAMISTHALTLSGYQFVTCVKVQWSGECHYESLSKYTVPFLNTATLTSMCPAHRVVQNWPSVVWVRGRFGQWGGLYLAHRALATPCGGDIGAAGFRVNRAGVKKRRMTRPSPLPSPLGSCSDKRSS
jgi:hypothetical protein